MKIIIWFIWVVLVMIWNFGVPGAAPIWDVQIAMILSIFSMILTALI